MKVSRIVLLAGCLSLGAPMAVSAAAPAGPAARSPADVRLRALFSDADEASLKLNPLEALARGDLRYADRFGDYLSDGYIDAERALAQHNLDALRAIDRSSLNPTDRIAYDVFAFRQQAQLRALAPDIVKIERLLPIDQMNGLQAEYPSMVSGKGVAPFKTVADYENNLKRMDGFVRYIDAAIGLMRQGLQQHVTEPRVVVDAMLKQIDALLAQGVAGSTFMGPVNAFPSGIPAADQARLKASYAEAVRSKIVPAYTRLDQFLKTDYLPAARTSIGLSALPGGDRLYAEKIEENTTLPLSADAVHKLGLSEVTRIRAEMEAIRRQVGFKGDLHQFFDYLRTSPRFKLKSEAEMGARYRQIAAIVEAHVPAQFSTVPKTPLDIRPVPAYKASVSPPAYYQGGTPDGSRPGVFYYNAYDLPSRTTTGMDTYFLHEGIPGHHFQISLAQENTALPNFMRFGGDTAYVEGWALYSEGLWKQMGVETDPYDRFGGLNGEIWRAIRLVVDSGIHAEGWTRDQAIRYFLDNSGVSRTDATAEVDRYIAVPGQALAYKIGQLTILRLKAKAQKALGPRFDPRAFHAQILDTGSLPMPVLEKKIDAWIASEQGAGH